MTRALHFRLPACAATVVALSLLGACASTPSPPRASDPLDAASSRSTLPSNVGPADCDPPSPSTEIELGLEVEVASEGDEIWALFEEPDVRAGTPLTVRWRIPGRSALELVLVGSGGREIVVDGEHPDPAVGWERLGDPWLSEITFPQPGCWRISATRGAVHGDLWVRVVQPGAS